MKLFPTLTRVFVGTHILLIRKWFIKKVALSCAKSKEVSVRGQKAFLLKKRVPLFGTSLESWTLALQLLDLLAHCKGNPAWTVVYLANWIAGFFVSSFGQMHATMIMAGIARRQMCDQSAHICGIQEPLTLIWISISMPQHRIKSSCPWGYMSR